MGQFDNKCRCGKLMSKENKFCSSKCYYEEFPHRVDGYYKSHPEELNMGENA